MAPSNLIDQECVPSSILIIGAGVFGLSTTIALLSSRRHDDSEITLLDPYLPSLENDTADIVPQNPHAASIDSSRIIRPDYAIPAYAKLANTAQEAWRSSYARGKEGTIVYLESGVALTAEGSGSDYVTRAGENARALGYNVQTLANGEDVGKLLGTGGGSGDSGYVNWGSGWADAQKAMEWAISLAVEKARERGKVVFRRGKVSRLLYEGKQQQQIKVIGARLQDGEELRADLTIVAAGAWSGALIDLRGRAEARGQVMAYVPVTRQEAEKLSDKPVLLNLTSGMFIIPPIWDTRLRQRVLKIARHGYGYGNPTSVSPEGKQITTSFPSSSFSPIPAEGEKACRAFLQQTIPWLGNRPFSSTRICWYTDTPSGDFLIEYHPSYAGLFMATGGSGHGFKFLPVLGEKIVAAIEGRLEEDLKGLWTWREQRVEGFGGTEDGSRGGERGMILEDEWSKEGTQHKSRL